MTETMIKALTKSLDDVIDEFGQDVLIHIKCIVYEAGGSIDMIEAALKELEIKE